MFKDLFTDTVSCVRLESRAKSQTSFTFVVVSGKAVQLLHHCSFFQWTGSLNGHLTEGSWGRHWVQRPLLTSTKQMMQRRRQRGARGAWPPPWGNFGPPSCEFIGKEELMFLNAQ